MICERLGPDGNLRVHNTDATTVWATPDHPESAPTSWQTGLAYPAQRASGGNCLHTYQWLAVGDFLIFASGQYAALLRGDGNLVLCGTSALQAQGAPPTDSVAVIRNDDTFAVLPGTNPNSTAAPR